MAIRIGNAAAPRWYDLSLDGLNRFIAYLQTQGATSTELVLHTGPADEHTRRVHVLQEDWESVFASFRAAGMHVHAHAPLSPRFKLDRWHSDRAGLQDDLRPILAAAANFAERQQSRCVLVLHAASGFNRGASESTSAALAWAIESPELSDADVTLALELRKPHDATDIRPDRRRATLTAFVDRLAHPRVGIAWDLGHDWETSHVDSSWSPIADPDFLRHVVHVHVHGSGGDERAVHFPLQSGSVPWQAMLSPLLSAGYDGAITMEVRYRYAVSLGEPWNVLGESYSLLRSFLDRES